MKTPTNDSFSAAEIEKRLTGREPATLPAFALDIAIAALGARLKPVRTFRDFWGGCVAGSAVLRKTRNDEDVTLPRAAFRAALKDAFEAGKAAR